MIINIIELVAPGVQPIVVQQAAVFFLAQPQAAQVGDDAVVVLLGNL